MPKRRGRNTKSVRNSTKNIATESRKEKVTPVASSKPSVHISTVNTMNTEDTSSDEEPTDYELLLSTLQPLKKLPRLEEKRESEGQSSGVVAEGDLVSDEAASDIQESDDSDADSDVADKVASKDPFSLHFEQDLEDDEIKTLTDVLSQPLTYKQTQSSLDLIVSQAVCLPSRNTVLCDCKGKSLQQLHIKNRLSSLWNPAVTEKVVRSKAIFTPLQEHLFSIMNSYKDMMFSRRSFENGEEIRRLYVLHALNHVLKTRSRVLKNNSKLSLAAKNGRDIGEVRDQGLTRPKVLILVPFREAALRTVKMIIKLLLPQGTGQVNHRKRFMEEFGEGESTTQSTSKSKPASFEAMFAGNIDDCFRVGVAVKRNIVRLYSEFYSSDIIITSPLGLRTIIRAEGDRKRDFDFLSSLEIVIVDQVDVYLMQNWDHLLHIFEHFHCQPKESHGVDFSRLRMWSINGWSKYYRQTLLFSSFQTPEINSLFNTHCFNYAGKVKDCERRYAGSISQVAIHVPQTFHRIHCQSHIGLPDARFKYFTENVLPEFMGELMKQTVVFIPSYFDFVRVRNYMNREELSFGQLCEYTKTSDVSRTRSNFFHGDLHFMLYTERLHFFRRYRIRGIRHMIFYSIPEYMEFYPELVNMMMEAGKVGGATCTILYSRYDALSLSRIVGSERANEMICVGSDIQTLVTGSQKQK